MTIFPLDQLLLFGDSITEYSNDPGLSFPLNAALNHHYIRRLDVVNRGFAGYNSKWALTILPEILSSLPRVKIATVFFGTNDAVDGGIQEVPLDQYVVNITRIVQLLKDRGIKVILITPGFHNRLQWEQVNDSPYLRSTERNKAYVDALRVLAQKESVALLNTYELFEQYDPLLSERETCEKLLTDGIHFNGDGYRLLYGELIKVIEENFPEFKQEELPFLSPNWRDVVEEGLL